MLNKSLGMIIAAGGSGSRFSKDVNKNLALYQGKPLIVHSLQTFLPVVSPGCMVVAAPQKLLVKMRNIVDEYLPDNHIKWTFGGATRLASVANACRMLPEELDLIAVHDAARPLATVELLKKLCRTALEVGGAVPGVTPCDTVKLIDEAGLIVQNLVRSKLANVATPQVFRFSKYCQALSLLSAGLLDGSEESTLFTDDAAIFCHAGFQVKVVQSKAPNPKVTQPGDIEKLGER